MATITIPDINVQSTTQLINVNISTYGSNQTITISSGETLLIDMARSIAWEELRTLEDIDLGKMGDMLGSNDPEMIKLASHILKEKTKYAGRIFECLARHTYYTLETIILEFNNKEKFNFRSYVRSNKRHVELSNEGDAGSRESFEGGRGA